MGHFVLGRISCFNPKTHGRLPNMVTHLNFGGTVVIASGNLVRCNMTGVIDSILSRTNVPCRVCDRIGPGPAIAGMRVNMRTFGRSNTSYLMTVNNNSTVSATGNVNVVVAGPRFTSIISLRKITPAGRGDMPVVTLPAATNATTRAAVGCIVVSRRGRGGVMYISPGSVPYYSVMSTRLVCSLPGNAATTANLSTLARTVRNCVAGTT